MKNDSDVPVSLLQAGVFLPVDGNGNVIIDEKGGQGQAKEGGKEGKSEGTLHDGTVVRPGLSHSHSKETPTAVNATAGGGGGGSGDSANGGVSVGVGVGGIGQPPVVLMPLSDHSAHTPLLLPDTITATTTTAIGSAPSSPSSRPISSSSSSSPKSHHDKGYSDKDKGTSQPPVTEAALALAAAVAEAELQAAKYTMCVGPGAWQPYGWADPLGDMSVTITVGTPPFGPDPKRVTVGLLKLNEITRLVIMDEEDEEEEGEREEGEGEQNGEKRKDREERGYERGYREGEGEGSGTIGLGKVTRTVVHRMSSSSSPSLLPSTSAKEGGTSASGSGRVNHEDNDPSKPPSQKTDENDENDEDDEEEEARRRKQHKHSKLEIFIAVQALGSGKIIRIVRHMRDFDSLELMAENQEEGKQEDYTTVQGAAIIGVAAVGFVAMGPLAPVGILGAAGVYYYHRYEQTRAEKVQKEKETIERMAQRAVQASLSSSYIILSCLYSLFTHPIVHPLILSNTPPTISPYYDPRRVPPEPSWPWVRARPPTPAPSISTNKPTTAVTTAVTATMVITALVFLLPLRLHRVGKYLHICPRPPHSGTPTDYICHNPPP